MIDLDKVRARYKNSPMPLDVRELIDEVVRLRDGIRGALSDGKTPEQRLMDDLDSGLSPEVLSNRTYFGLVDKLWALLGYKDVDLKLHRGGKT